MANHTDMRRLHSELATDRGGIELCIKREQEHRAIAIRHEPEAIADAIQVETARR